MRMSLPCRVQVRFGSVALSAVSLLSANPLHARNTEVEVLSCQESSQRAHITFELNGNSAKDVIVVVATLKNRQVQSLNLDGYGRAILPHLPPGKYLVTASAPNNMRASLCVSITSSDGKQVSVFSLVLNTLPPPPPTMDELLTAAESKPPVERIREFRGILLDPAGAVVPGVVIQIFPKGVRGDQRAFKSETGDLGQFGTLLSEGSYTAIFTLPGFQTKIVTFEVTTAGATTGLRISFQLGKTT